MPFQRQDQRQGQELALTAGMQQSLHILRLGNRDITGLLHEEAARNPFLRLSGRPAPAPPDGAENQAGSTSLAEHVAGQIGLLFRDPLARAFAHHIAAALEPTGWLGRPLAELAAEMAMPPPQAEAVLARLQEIEPAGLFARSLRECLELQARDAGVMTAALAAVLARLDLLARSGLAALARDTALPEADLAAALRVIRSFDPKPGLRFAAETGALLLCDLRVSAGADGWQVEVNDDALPAIRVDERPRHLPDRRDHRALVELARQARDLQRMVSRRKETLLAIGSAIIARQSGFLRDGPMALLPLSLAHIAEDTGLHVSTISRAVSATLIETPKGTLPLRAFFTRPVQIGQGLLVAQGSLAALIARILAEEDPATPLTDDQVAGAVADLGLTITRRTVTNHRRALNIPTAAERARPR